MLWNGVEVQCDHNGWMHMNKRTTAGWFLIEANVRRSELLVSFAGAGKLCWNDPDGVTLAVACIQFGSPVQPLLDWCLENADRVNMSDWIRQSGWVQETLELAIRTVAEGV